MREAIATDSAVADWLAARRAAEVAAWTSAPGSGGYEHPYGFTVIRLPQPLLAGWQVRVHLWPPHDLQQERLRRNGTEHQQVHAHGWRIWSRVLVGAIDEHSYEIVDEPASALGLYSVVTDYQADVSRLRLERPHVTATRTNRMVRTPDTGHYLIPTGLHHASGGVGEAWSVSLVATEVVNGPTSTLVAPARLGEATLNERKPSRDLPLLAVLLG